MKLTHLILLPSLFGSCAFSLECLAQSDSPAPPDQASAPYAVISYSPDQSVVSACQNGVFQLVGLQPDQIVQVTIQCPADQASRVTSLEASDGGTLFAATGRGAKRISIVADTDNKLTFSFQASHNPGRNQITIRQGAQELGLQFWVSDMQNPQENPDTLTPNTPVVVID